MIKEEDFERAEAAAENEVRAVIGPLRWETITPDTPFFDVLLDCIAKVIDYKAQLEKTPAGKGVTSVSNDGYTENYAIANQSQVGEEIKRNIKAWLSGTGLVGAY